MSLTQRYSKMHTAFVLVARGHELTPFDVRVLLAVADRGGSARSDEIGADLILSSSNQSSFRRSSLGLRATGHVIGSASNGRGRVKRGERHVLKLTEKGWRTVQQFRLLADTMLGEEARSA
jgi:hypothetical protein